MKNKMKTKKIGKASTKKTIFIITILVVGLAIALYSLEFFGVTNIIPNSPKIAQTPGQIQQNANDTKSKEDLTNNQLSNSSNNTVPDPTSNDISISSTESVDNIIISTQLKNYSDGECNISITNGARSYNQSVPVIYQASFSTCAGFSVAKSELGSGVWSISLSVTSNGQTNTQTSTIEVK